MKTFITFALLILTAGAQPPAVIYPSRVVSEADDVWARVYKRVLAGDVILTEHVPGEPKGRYRCFLDNGVPRYLVETEVVKPRPGIVHNATHQCPNCGHSQYRIAGYLANGEHMHKCGSCGTTWRH